MADTDNLKMQLNAQAKKYAKKEAAGDPRVEQAYIEGGKCWNRIAAKALQDYEQDMHDALIEMNGKVTPWERLQIRKTARLWYNRDRLADEIDMEERLMRVGIGSTNQMTEKLDQRLVLLEKMDRTLTADLAAIGLNAGGKQNGKQDDDSKRDNLAKMLHDAQSSMLDIPDDEE